MGRKTTTNQNSGGNVANHGEFATANIKGVVTGFYDKGKKYDYITVDVRHDYDEYYDRFKVAVSKSYDVPNDGEPIELVATIKNYKGDITFKEINADTQ